MGRWSVTHFAGGGLPDTLHLPLLLRPTPTAMAFESSGSGGFTRQASGGSGLVRGSSARAGSGAPATLAATYQGTEDSVWESVRRRVEDELRGFAQLTQQLERSVGLVGGARDSEEVRRRIAEGLSKGKTSLHDIGVLLKSTLADAVAHGDAELSQKERTARKNQQQKFVKDWGAASTSFSEVREGVWHTVRLSAESWPLLLCPVLCLSPPLTPPPLSHPPCALPSADSKAVAGEEQAAASASQGSWRRRQEGLPLHGRCFSHCHQGRGGGIVSATPAAAGSLSHAGSLSRSQTTHTHTHTHTTLTAV